MKRYSVAFSAGVPIDFDHPGRFFTLLGCITPVNVALTQIGQQSEVLENVTPGLWVDTEDQPFSRIRITSPVDQTVVFLVSMVRSGFDREPNFVLESSTPMGALAISATIASPIVDLGEHWSDILLTSFFINATASAGAVFSIRCGREPTVALRSLAVSKFNPTAQAFMTTGSGNGYMSSMMPTGRYVKAEFVNGATAQAASGEVVLQVHRNV